MLLQLRATDTLLKTRTHASKDPGDVKLTDAKGLGKGKSTGAIG